MKHYNLLLPLIGIQLCDLSNDPTEEVDLAITYKEKVEELSIL